MRFDPFLSIVIYIISWDKATDLEYWTRVFTSLNSIHLFFIPDETTESIILFSWKIVALTFIGIPNLNMFIDGISSQYEETFSIGESFTDHQERFIVISFSSIDVVEIVA